MRNVTRSVLVALSAFVVGAAGALLVLALAAQRGVRVYLEVVRFAYARQESELANRALASGDARASVGHAYCAAFANGGSGALGTEAPPWHAGFLLAGVLMPEPSRFGGADPNDFEALRRARLGFALERSGDLLGSEEQYQLAARTGGRNAAFWKARAATSFSLNPSNSGEVAPKK
ncbi:hypothetical protein [Anaeromyxobacter oryzisoli]|uniref:hypothetical protein n=1 Tax=Anaeromyxobacter oryzisoli TaxID=2925408 RepID=UPI001F585DF5|nr:hypothetical protein [Anaeromyxobacter sp. SG63]